MRPGYLDSNFDPIDLDVHNEKLKRARAEFDTVQREHHSIVHKANVAVKASKTKFAAAERKVRDLEFALTELEAARIRVLQREQR
jgi:hypothetical protein